jgi:hypothetical protein
VPDDGDDDDDGSVDGDESTDELDVDDEVVVVFMIPKHYYVLQ